MNSDILTYCLSNNRVEVSTVDKMYVTSVSVTPTVIVVLDT